jgi:hypothetical protein
MHDEQLPFLAIVAIYGLGCAAIGSGTTYAITYGLMSWTHVACVVGGFAFGGWLFYNLK